MTQEKIYESYPLWIIIVSSLLSISIYAIGGFILYRIGLIWSVAYFIYILLLEVRLLKKSCVNCYYFGKACAFGKGRLSSLFFRKGDAQKFASWQVTWKDIIPDFMVSVIPMAAAIVLLIREFSLLTLALLIALFMLGFIGNGIVRSQLACNHCKQRVIGCPAEKLFSKSKR